MKAVIAGILLVVQLTTLTFAKNTVGVSLDEHHSTSATTPSHVAGAPAATFTTPANALNPADDTATSPSRSDRINPRLRQRQPTKAPGGSSPTVAASPPIVAPSVTSTPRLKQTEHVHTKHKLSAAQLALVHSLSSEQKEALRRLEVDTRNHLTELRREQHEIESNLLAHHTQLLHAGAVVQKHLEELKQERTNLEAAIEHDKLQLREHQSTRMKTKIIQHIQTSVEQHQQSMSGNDQEQLKFKAVEKGPVDPPAPPIVNRDFIQFDCKDRLVDYVDRLFAVAPEATNNNYIITCPPCSYPKSHPLNVWGKSKSWYTLDSIFCAAANHDFDYSGGGKYQVTVELNVLTGRMPTFEGEPDLDSASGGFPATRSWHGPYPVIFHVEEFVEVPNPPTPALPPPPEVILAALRSRSNGTPTLLPAGFLQSLKMLAHDKLK